MAANRRQLYRRPLPPPVIKGIGAINNGNVFTPVISGYNGRRFPGFSYLPPLTIDLDMLSRCSHDSKPGSATSRIQTRTNGRPLYSWRMRSLSDRQLLRRRRLRGYSSIQQRQIVHSQSYSVINPTPCVWTPSDIGAQRHVISSTSGTSITSARKPWPKFQSRPRHDYAGGFDRNLEKQERLGRSFPQEFPFWLMPSAPRTSGMP